MIQAVGEQREWLPIGDWVVDGGNNELRRGRVAVALTDAANGALLASGTYEAEGGTSFEMHDRIVRNIVGKLHVKLTDAFGTRSADPKFAEILRAGLRKAGF